MGIISTQALFGCGNVVLLWFKYPSMQRCRYPYGGRCPKLPFPAHPFELMKWTFRESNMAFKRSVLGEQMKPILAASARFVLFQAGDINAESRTEGD